MAITDIQQEEPRLAPEILAVLRALRCRVRQYVWVEGLATAIASLGVAFWGSLAIDWFFEPPPAVRGVILGLVGLVLAGVLVKLIGRRAFVRITDSNMAMLLERRFPQLDDSLLTAVDLIGRGTDHEDYDPLMLVRTCRQAAGDIVGLRLGKVFNPVPLRNGITAAVLMTASVLLFAVTLPDAFGTWTRRSLALSEELWPRRTRLLVEGFEDGTAKVARGADLDLIAKADTNMPLVPKVVHVRYRTEGGARVREAMNREGTAERGKDGFQEYSYTFRGVLVPIRFDVVGGDDRVRDLRIDVVESPTIVRMVLDFEFPKYMGRASRTVPVTGVMQVPLGTNVTIRAKANKELVRVQVDSALEGAEKGTRFNLCEAPSRPFRQIKPGPFFGPGSSRHDFRYALGSFRKDKTLLFTLFDADGIRSREPVRLALAMVPDEPPELAVQLAGIGSAVTAHARLPVEGRVTDDYGIARVWFEHAIDQKKPGTRPIQSPDGNPTDVKLDDALEVRDLELTPGQKLLVSVKSADRFDLAKQPNILARQPNIGSSQRWLLDVVTPEQLRAMLQSRELVLRQRFEMIIHEVTDTGDSLLRIDLGKADTADTDNTDSKADKTGDRPGSEPGDELGDEPGDEEKEVRSPERLLALRMLRVQRAIQNSRKNAHETLGVAEAFDNIRLQLVNNRIDTEELNLRLAGGIAEPLRRVVEGMFPELETRLKRLEGTLADEKAGPENRLAASRQLDAILVEMRQVLSRMIELEDFNEAVALLRAIIESQEKLGKQTKERRKQELRELLED